MKFVPALFCTVLLISAPAPTPTSVGSAPEVDEFTRIVASVGPGGNADLKKLAGEIARLPDALDAFFVIGSTGQVPGSDDRPHELTEEQARLLAYTAACFESRSVVLFVGEHLTEEADDAWRRTALRLLAEHGAPKDFSLLARLVVLDRSTQAVRGALLGSFQDAVVAINRRHGLELRELNWLANEAEPLRGVLIRAVGNSGNPEGLRWLALHLDDPDYEAPALQEIGRLAPRANAELASVTARSVGPLLKSEELSTRKHAIGALGALGDPAAIPFLIVALGQGTTSGERKMAHSALRQVSGVDLPAQPEAWERWYAQEQRWLKKEGPAALGRLGSDEDAQVVAAIRNLSEHTLHRERLAADLAPLLSSHRSSAVRGQVCLALARLGSEQSVPGLVAALGDDDPAVRRHAHTALLAISKLRLPPDRSAWAEALDLTP